ncbi:class III extradiol ring-cleavage dioxygenase [Aquabacterium sp. J223]|uniref:DODA-type extradiol aromatic ring-opening family dioxygenase n=1 Tax=Aquabacterium sp. J223 TaxID=2898431 RepID=UPI0021AD7547|nr:class III extradiol ring-cleavage dioxygenase [Aquabacterium sp. J223]UUX95112.1 dioxygenase [Aquabacterium sp. J223]
MALLPTYFISHGGGPWPYMPDRRAHLQTLERSLADMPRQLPERPRALLMVTGHWEAPAFTVGTAERPGMLYDYYGFPPHTYEVVYPAPGEPSVARRVRQLIEQAGLPAAEDAERGFDHGTFTPLAVMYPQADMPVVQLSLHHSLDPAAHLALGRALAPLRAEGVLIVGSGLSWHNLRLMGPAAREPSTRFDAWLQQTLVESPPAERTERLLHWSQAPAARLAHPREDHFIPLLAAVGAAEHDPATVVYHQEGVFGGVTASSFRFDATS